MNNRSVNTIFNLHPRFAFGSGGNSGAAAFSSDFTQGTMPSGTMLSRASGATYWDYAGVRQVASTDQARFDYDPITLQLRGVLIEPQRTNFLLNSLTPVTQVITLATGTYTLWHEGSGSVTSSATTAVGTGFGSSVSGALGTYGTPNTFVITTAGTVTITVTGTVTSFQVEDGTFATSLIITTGAQATRSRDDMTSNIASVYNNLEGSFVAEHMPSQNNTSGVIATLSDGTIGNYHLFNHRSSATQEAYIIRVSGTNTLALLVTPLPATFSPTRIGAGYKALDSIVVTPSSQTTSAANPTIPSGVTTVTYGARVTMDYLSGWIRSFSYYRTRIPNQQLTDLVQAAYPLRLGVSRTVWMGDSITAATGASSIADWTDFFLSGKLVPVVGYNQGVSGNQTTQMLARQSVGLALNPNLYMILAGTNDIVVGGRSAAAIQTDLQSLIDNALATPSVAAVCIRTILKRSDASFLGNPAFQTTMTAVNDWIRAISNPRVIVIDYDQSTFDPTVDTNDGLHPNNFGANKLARYTAEKLLAYMPATNVLADKTGNLMPTNGDLAGTGGGLTGATGQVATGYQLRNFVTGITAVASKGTLDGATSQVITLNGTASNSGNCQFRCPVTYAGNTGESYEFMIRAKITSTNKNVRNIQSTSDASISFGNGTVTLPLNQDFDGVIRMGQSTLAAPDTSNVIDVDVTVTIGLVDNLRIELSEPIFRRVA